MSPRNFKLAGKMGLAIPFDGESFAGGQAGEHRLPRLWAHCKFHDIRSSELAKFEEIATEFCKCLNGPAYFEVM